MELALELGRVSRRIIRPQVGEGGSGASHPNSRPATRAGPGIEPVAHRGQERSRESQSEAPPRPSCCSGAR